MLGPLANYMVLIETRNRKVNKGYKLDYDDHIRYKYGYMEKILTTLFMAGCSVKFEQEFYQVKITMTRTRDDKEITQVLPFDHLYDEKVLYCIEFCITKLREDGKEEMV